MPAENEKQNIENENYETSSELLDLKKKLADEVVDKLLEKDPGLFSYILKKGLISDYLVDEKNIEDTLHDEVLIGGIGKSIISPEIKKYREMINQAETKDELEDLRTKIFNEISGNNSSEISEQTNTPTSTASTTSTTEITTTTDSSSTTEKAQVEAGESLALSNIEFTISPESKKIRESLKGKNKPDLEPFACALKVYNNVKGKIHNTKYLTVVDFSKKKGKKRFFVINMENNTVEHAVKVGHGKNTGGERAKQFSNKSGSKQSSLGGYLLPDTITKSPNKSWSGLRQITGLESSNSNAAQRGIAVHPGGENGSEGCFTLPKDISKNIMEKIKGGFLFAYAKSKDYFAQSNYFKQNSDGSIMA